MAITVSPARTAIISAPLLSTLFIDFGGLK